MFMLDKLNNVRHLTFRCGGAKGKKEGICKNRRRKLFLDKENEKVLLGLLAVFAVTSLEERG